MTLVVRQTYRDPGPTGELASTTEVQVHRWNMVRQVSESKSADGDLTSNVSSMTN